MVAQASTRKRELCEWALAPGSNCQLFPLFHACLHALARVGSTRLLLPAPSCPRTGALCLAQHFLTPGPLVRTHACTCAASPWAWMVPHPLTHFMHVSLSCLRRMVNWPKVRSGEKESQPTTHTIRGNGLDPCHPDLEGINIYLQDSEDGVLCKIRVRFLTSGPRAGHWPLSDNYEYRLRMNVMRQRRLLCPVLG